ncbi:MAG: universal stress protein [Pseudomonadota bacterium]|nr:universal stress protein [Pseudomonadota bacterium]MDO7710776.1 universal stress protein [Pseudomonadota bacterium]
MGNYQHILIAADFSEHSQQVVNRAQEIAERYQAKLSICHIIEDFPIADFAYEPMISIDLDMRDAMLDSGKKHIADIAKKLDLPTANQWVEFGSPSLNIVSLANDNKVDLIVVGSHGRHGIKLLLGSTANGVLHHALCDVLAVRLTEQ